nr:MAG TPA: hypothetical protein [Caudoviricetes sp.]
MTVIPPVKQSSVEVLYAIICCIFLCCPIFLFDVLI